MIFERNFDCALPRGDGLLESSGPLEFPSRRGRAAGTASTVRHGIRALFSKAGVNIPSPLAGAGGTPLVGSGRNGRMRGKSNGLWLRPPHPPLRGTFSREGRREFRRLSAAPPLPARHLLPRGEKGESGLVRRVGKSRRTVLPFRPPCMSEGLKGGGVEARDFR